ncbi:MAG TPA: response regulator transcription factor [Methylomirabilota bacterium]|nr:response regulator transcription factor [Methylomirabilota bacterium]
MAHPMLPKSERRGVMAARRPGLMPTTVVVADDDHDLRSLILLMLSTTPDLEVVGQAGDGAAALEVVRRTRPDVAIVDIAMPGLDGFELTRRIKREWPRTTVLVMTSLVEEVYRDTAYQNGADAFLDKRDLPAALVATIHRTATPRPEPPPRPEA